MSKKVFWIVVFFVFLIVFFFTGGTANSPAKTPAPVPVDARGMPLVHPTPRPEDIAVSNSKTSVDRFFVGTDPANPKKQIVDTLVIIFNPIGPDGETLSSYMGWRDPSQLAIEHGENIYLLSGGSMEHQIVETIEINGWPKKEYVSQSYDWDKYQGCLSDDRQCIFPDEADLGKIYSDYGVCQKYNSGEIDSVFVFGGPYFGFPESNMTGGKAFWLNSFPTEMYGTTKCKKALNIWLFSYHVGTDYMLHNVGHGVESLLWARCGVWRGTPFIGPYRWPNPGADCPWEVFSRDYTQQDDGKGEWSGAGNTHGYVNSSKDYSYCEQDQYLFADRDDWTNDPGLSTSSLKLQNHTAWGCGMQDFLFWWFSMIPNKVGICGDGTPCNWWFYYVEPQCAVETCKYPQWVTGEYDLYLPLVSK